jgi:hypothetical protein
MVRHYLKTWPEFFAALMSGEKNFELRRDDRHFRAGDILHLREYDSAQKTYSGREVERRVVYILEHRAEAGCAATFGLMPGYVIMGLRADVGSPREGHEDAR